MFYLTSKRLEHGKQDRWSWERKQMLWVGEGEERMRGRKREVNRRRGRCSCLGCLCTNNYPDEIHREQHKMRRKRRSRIWGRPHDAETTELEGNKGRFFSIYIDAFWCDDWMCSCRLCCYLLFLPHPSRVLAHLAMHVSEKVEPPSHLLKDA